MNRIEIINKLDAIISASVNHHNFVMSEDLQPQDVDKWNSLANAMIVTAIEQDFQIKFKFTELVAWKTIGQLIDIIEKKLA